MIKNDRDVTRLKIPAGQKSVTQPVKTVAPAGGLFLLKRITDAGNESMTWFFRHDGKRVTVGNARTDYATACELFRVKMGQTLRNEITPEDERPRWTLDTLFNRWIDAEGKPGSAVDLSRLWRKHFSPVCGDLMAIDMTYRRIVQIMNEARAGMLERDGKVQNNALSRGARFFPRMFAYGYKHGIATPDDQPIVVPQTLKDSIDNNQMPPKAKPRQASITATQYRQLFDDLPDNDAGNALRLIMLTGRRKNEVVEMARQELRGDVWIIPGSRSKNGKPQEVPLFASLRAAIGRSAHEVGRLWTCGGTTLNAVLSRLGVMASYDDEQTGEPVAVPCTVHDLRRSWSNILRIDVGLERETVDLMLAHTLQDYDQTSRTYQKIKDIHAAAVADGWQRWDAYWRGETEQSFTNRKN